MGEAALGAYRWAFLATGATTDRIRRDWGDQFTSDLQETRKQRLWPRSATTIPGSNLVRRR